MAGLPKKYAKMGFKKGWLAYKKSKSRSRSGSIIRSRSRSKTKRSYTMARKKKTYRKSSSLLGKLNNPLLGAAGVVAYESIISPMIPLQGTAKDMLELVGGLYLSKKKGIIGATGKSLVVLNSYQLVSGLVGNKLSGLFNKAPTSAYEYN